MATKEAREILKKSRRSKKRQPGDGSLMRRFIFLTITSLLVTFTYYYIKTYKTSLPLYQQNTIIAFHAFYILRTNIGNFMTRLDAYYSWIGVVMLSVFIFPFITLPMTFFANPMEDTFGFKYLTFLSILLYMIGSVIHSSYEFTRFFFKQNVTKNKLYTSGLSAVVRHPNFFGDLLLFFGWAVVSNNFWCLLVPCYQFWHFYKTVIPELETYLRAKYGEVQYNKYAKDVKALIPLII